MVIFHRVARNKVTQVLEVVPFEEQSDDLKKRLAKNNEAKMVLYSALPKKEYERVFMCKTAKDIWLPLLITHQGNIQVKDNTIDLLVQQYEQFTILEEESIDSSFARINTIITSLKALDEGFSSKNYPQQNKDQKAFIGGSWSDSEDEAEDKTNNETCLMAQSSNEVTLNSSHYSDNASFLNDDSITHNFSAPRTPQSNGVVERTNRTLQEMSKTMLNEQSILQKFCCNAVDTSTYILNRILIRPILGKTPYEIYRGRKPSLEYFKAFGSKCFILNTKDYLIKFDPKSYEDVFLGYSQNSKAYILLNKHTMKVKESLNVTFDESPRPTKLSPLVDDDVGEEDAIENNIKIVNNNNIDDESIEVDDVINIKESKNHLLGQVIGNLNQR
ncbi:retrovirus-related pol polyprotein from transposon TNT 1-94 [Tanacetum coccineum]